MHTSCRALGGATRGHNAVANLIPGTDLRPADVLTSALGNVCTALDIATHLGGWLGLQPVHSGGQSHCGPHLLALQRPDRVERPWRDSPRHVDRSVVAKLPTELVSDGYVLLCASCVDLFSCASQTPVSLVLSRALVPPSLLAPLAVVSAASSNVFFELALWSAGAAR